jgi:hypothetical protein
MMSHTLVVCRPINRVKADVLVNCVAGTERVAPLSEARRCLTPDAPPAFEAMTAKSFPPDQVENLLPARSLLGLDRRKPAYHPFMNVFALIVRVIDE